MQQTNPPYHQEKLKDMTMTHYLITVSLLCQHYTINYICSIIEKMYNLFLGHEAFLNRRQTKHADYVFRNQKEIFLDEYLV